MNLTTVFLLAICLSANAKVFSQRVSLSEKNAPLEKIFKEITRQTGYTFVYTRSLLKKSKNISINVQNAPIERSLDICFKEQPLTYTILNTMVIIKEKEIIVPKEIIYTPPPTAINPPPITGKITDDKGQPLEGATILVKGAQTGTKSDANGNFSIDAEPNSTLVISYVGFESAEVNVGSRTNILVRLNSSLAISDEVVVVGYETVKKSDLTGSVGTLKMSDITKAPVGSFVDALAGRIAGVQVSSAEGTPGQLPDIIIRGPGSATQSNAPLYVIDGFPTEDADATRLNIDDIESVTVLKDASATAIYGSRAANGVIIIETKRGKIGKPVISYNAYLGYQPATKTVPLMNAYEYVKYVTENSSGTRIAYLDSNMTLDDYKNVKSLDWQDIVFRDALTQSHSIAVRGGSATTKYSLSGSIYNKNGVVINSDYNRVQGRLSLDQEVTKKITVGITADYNRFNTNGQTVSAGDIASGNLGIRNYFFMQVWAFPPVAALKDTLSDGELMDLEEQERDPSNENTSISPLNSAKNIKQKSSTEALNTTMYLNYAINKNLTLRLRGSYNASQNERYRFRAARAASLVSTDGSTATHSTNNSKNWSTDNTLTWVKDINNNHLDVMAGVSAGGNNSTSFGYGTSNIPVEALGIYGIAIGVPASFVASANESKLRSFFGRINYGYKSKYLLTFTYRGDGSTKFVGKNRWGYFPSAAVAWNMKKESFLRNLNFISSSKLRFSYGITGNNRVGSYSAYPQLEVDRGYSFNNEANSYQATVTSMGNSALKWESTKQFDLGYDLALFQNRLTVVIDLYRKTTENMLLNASLPPSIGFTSAYENIGSMKNEGIELSFNSVNLSSSKFRWLSSFNISFNTNTILSLSNGQDNLFSNARYSSAWSLPLYRAQVGKPMGMFYGFIYEGPYPYSDFNLVGEDTYVLKDEVAPVGTADQRSKQKPGDMKYKDVNGDGAIDVNDEVNLGRGQPIHTGGFLNDFFYRGFELSLFLQWSYGSNLMNANRIELEGNESDVGRYNQYASYADRWSDDNQTSKNFRPGGSGPAYFSNRVLEDGSYIRLKTVFLGYQFTHDRIKKLGMSSLQIGISAQNLFTLTNYSGLDPEVSVMGLSSVLTPSFDFSAYPQGRTITLSLNASF